ncbi:MotA/TolQ/ExbB proton channel family protein [Pseudohoeflea coraliihabitans]|uniref:MotA/TolQ/ExbB proton channel family protein n=1 Tax=Pseudohoeflea coraliihabitans TaxID=2860393 RepID=A0ABS6WQ01_9HYPH|nr:MotA/TolQ/ExbB proton channel family protein [Pseudohoeflea sp. DP4N28-3]MBW3097713.1 MotA/TolQ/ExbB proton channel family protein [Pseudohoeflea sp. DP4N28-3]
MTDIIVSQMGALIDLGGPVVVILLAGSILSLAVILLKIFHFSYAGVGSHRHSAQAASLWAAGRSREAFDLASQGRNPAAKTVAEAIALRMTKRIDKEAIEERLGRLATEQLHDLQSGFRFLDAIAQLAPLLGLFGTVLGMIEAFKQLQSAGNAVDPSILAGGIWVALLTTAVGLAVAMPTSLVLTWLETRVENERVAIQTLTTDILAGTALPADVVQRKGLAAEAQLAS